MVRRTFYLKHFNLIFLLQKNTSENFCSMTAAFKNDLVQQIEQMSRFQEQSLRLTSKCWDLCVEKPETRLGSHAETCLKNCVERFIDTNNFITNRFQVSLMERSHSSASDSSFD